MRVERLNASPVASCPTLSLSTRGSASESIPGSTASGSGGWLSSSSRASSFSRACGSISRAGCPRRRSCLPTSPRCPTNVRGYDGTPVQTFARERRVELSYEEYPPLVVQTPSSRRRTRPSSAMAASIIRAWSAPCSISRPRPRPAAAARRAARRSPSRSRNISSRTAATRSAARRARRSSLSGWNRRSARNRSSKSTSTRSSSAGMLMASRPRAAPISTRTSIS